MAKEDNETLAQAMSDLGEAWSKFGLAMIGEIETDLALVSNSVSRCTTRVMSIVTNRLVGHYLFVPANEDGKSDEDIAGKALAPRKWFVVIKGAGKEKWLDARNRYDEVSWEYGYQYNWWERDGLVKGGFEEKTWEQFCEFYNYD